MPNLRALVLFPPSLLKVLLFSPPTFAWLSHTKHITLPRLPGPPTCLHRGNVPSQQNAALHSACRLCICIHMINASRSVCSVCLGPAAAFKRATPGVVRVHVTLLTGSPCVARRNLRLWTERVGEGEAETSARPQTCPLV